MYQHVIRQQDTRRGEFSETCETYETCETCETYETYESCEPQMRQLRLFLRCPPVNLLIQRTGAVNQRPICRDFE